jgi:hypothetical protein
MRKVTALLMLASVATQPAAGSMLATGALLIVLHGSHHAHAISIVSEDGHRHLVLSHDTAGSFDDNRGAVDTDSPAPSFSESEHIFHFASDDPVNTAARRRDAAPAPVVAIAAAPPFASAPVAGFRFSLEPRASGADHLRTVVLRL